MSALSETNTQPYNYGIIRLFTIMAVFWGVLGMLAGVYIALELTWPIFNFDTPAITFGRLRPVHTTLVIFGFGGSALFATSYYVVQRTCQVRLSSDVMANITFWGWQASILLAVIGYMSGYTQAREYAEMVWPIDILIAVTWVTYFILYVHTLARRSQPHIYVANWFFVAFILATAILHIFNNMEVPISVFSLKSYSDDAVVVWAQRSRVLFNSCVPRHDVLFCAQAGRASCIFLSSFDHPLLGTGVPVYVGWCAPLALDCIA